MQKPYNVRPPLDSVQLVYNYNNYGLWYANNELVTGANLNQLSYRTGASHGINSALLTAMDTPHILLHRSLGFGSAVYGKSKK